MFKRQACLIIGRSLSKWRHFEWCTSTGREGLLPFNLLDNNEFCIAKCLYSSRDDVTEGLGKTTTQECKKSIL